MSQDSNNNEAERPVQNLCGGYYCSEDHGHIDCELAEDNPDDDEIAVLHELGSCGGDCPNCQAERAERREGLI